MYDYTLRPSATRPPQPCLSIWLRFLVVMIVAALSALTLFEIFEGDAVEYVTE